MVFNMVYGSLRDAIDFGVARTNLEFCHLKDLTAPVLIGMVIGYLHVRDHGIDELGESGPR